MCDVIISVLEYCHHFQRLLWESNSQLWIDQGFAEILALKNCFYIYHDNNWPPPQCSLSALRNVVMSRECEITISTLIINIIWFKQRFLSSPSKQISQLKKMLRSVCCLSWLWWSASVFMQFSSRNLWKIFLNSFL